MRPLLSGSGLQNNELVPKPGGREPSVRWVKLLEKPVKPDQGPARFSVKSKE
jgi:hypothetical protein